VLLRARYDDAGRAVEAGDAAGAYLFEYEAPLDAASRRTTVTDPTGAKTVFTHNGRGALTTIADEEGQLASSIEYNAANRPARVSDSLGNEVTFAYDSQNRLLRQSSSDAVEKSYTYDERGRISSITDGGLRTDYTLDARGNVSSARSGDPSTSYEAARNARGQLISLASKGGRSVSFGYDAAGNRTAVTFSDAGRFKTEYDSAGRMVAERLPSGLAYAYGYDARGQLTKQSDNEGHSMTLERDASGALVGVASADGRWVRAARDRAGRIIALSNSSGKSRRYEYDARGSLTGYTDARGRRHAFTYDHRGRLLGFFDQDGTGVRYDYDRAGRLIAASHAGRLHTGAARLMPASYEPPGLSSPAQDEFGGCLFGGDGWFDGDTFYQDFGMSCDDPFAGFGDFYDPGGLFYGSSPEACSFCKARRKAICEAEWMAKYKKAVGADIVATAACALISAGTLAIVCAIAAGVYAVSQVSAANDEYNACILSIPDQCTMFCPNG
jgi:YD repeat-containing protein